MGKKKKKPKINLVAILEKKGITKYRFAQLLGKHTSHISVFVRDDYNPTFSTLVMWAEVLDCKVSDFIEE